MQIDSLVLILALLGAFAVGFVLGLLANTLRRILLGAWRAPGRMAHSVSRLGTRLRQGLRRPEPGEGPAGHQEIPLPDQPVSRAVAIMLTFPLRRAQALFEMGEEAFAEGQDRVAEGHYRAALVWDRGRGLPPLHVRANLRLGQIRMLRGEINSAITAYERVRDMDPANVEAYLQLGELYFRDGRPGAALYELGRALELDPTNLEVRYRLFQIYQQSGMQEEALRQLRVLKAGERPEVIAELFFQHGQEHLQLDTLDLAGTDFHLVLELTPEREEAIWALGDILQRQGHPQHAMQVWAKGLLIAPSPALDQRLLALARQDGLWEDVAVIYQRALLLFPRRGRFYLALGEMAQERNQTEQAGGYWERAITVQPDLVEAHIRLEQHYERAGRRDQARSHLRAALRLLWGRETVYRCSVCGQVTPIEQPYCFACNTWDSLEALTRAELEASSALVPISLAQETQSFIRRLGGWWGQIRGLLSGPSKEKE